MNSNRKMKKANLHEHFVTASKKLIKRKKKDNSYMSMEAGRIDDGKLHVEVFKNDKKHLFTLSFDRLTPLQ